MIHWEKKNEPACGYTSDLADWHDCVSLKPTHKPEIGSHAGNLRGHPQTVQYIPSHKHYINVDIRNSQKRSVQNYHGADFGTTSLSSADIWLLKLYFCFDVPSKGIYFRLRPLRLSSEKVLAAGSGEGALTAGNLSSPYEAFPL